MRLPCRMESPSAVIAFSGCGCAVQTALMLPQNFQPLVSEALPVVGEGLFSLGQRLRKLFCLSIWGLLWQSHTGTS